MTGLDQVILGWTIGTTELIVLLIVALLIWGRRLPEIARSMGRSVFEFKKGLREAEQAKQEIADEILKAGEEAKNGSSGSHRP
jgi:sec-independent protein translocase protein TatA